LGLPQEMASASCTGQLARIRSSAGRVKSGPHASNGRSRRIADIADRGLGRLRRAVSTPTDVASGRIAVRAIAVIPWRARNRFTARSRRSSCLAKSEPQRNETPAWQKSSGEWPGILAWLVEGCLEWSARLCAGSLAPRAAPMSGRSAARPTPQRRGAFVWRGPAPPSK
jgi:hypothetical protein